MGILRQLKRPKVLFPLFTAFIIIVVIALAVRTLNSPAQGTVTTQVSDTTAGRPKDQPAYKTYSDQTVTFNYPDRYDASPGDKSSGYIDAIRLDKTSQRTEFANIGIYKGSLTNESGINYRRTHPELYKSVPTGEGTVVYEKSDSTEYTGFLQKGPDVITISFTSVGTHDFAGYSFQRVIAGTGITSAAAAKAVTVKLVIRSGRQGGKGSGAAGAEKRQRDDD